MRKISQRQQKRALLRVKDVLIPVEVADTAEALRKGLQGRKELHGGMLFVHPQAETVSYWMRGTKIPLSIAFISEDGTIVHTANMKPQDEGPCRSPEPVKFALEVPEGLFERQGIEVGDKVTITAASVNLTGLSEEVSAQIATHRLVDESIPDEVYDYVRVEGTIESPTVILIRGLQTIEGPPSTMGDAVAAKARAVEAPVSKEWVEKWYDAIRFAVSETEDAIERGERLDELEV